MDVIKTEFNLMCHGCLSNDRRIFPLGDNSEMFLNIIGNQKQCLLYSTDDIKLCWECVAKLKNFKIFQTQLRKAQDVLTQFLYGLESSPAPLSTLTTTTKCLYDYEVQQENTTKRKRKKTIIEDTKKNPLKELNIKLEVATLDIENVDKKAEVIYAHEVTADVSGDDSKADITKADDIKNYDPDTFAKNEDFDDELFYDSKMEPEEKESKERKKKKKHTDPWRTYAKLYKEQATLIEKRQIEWGDIDTYFTTLKFNEKEMEQYILTKERTCKDLKRYPVSCNMCKRGYKHNTDLKRHNNLNHHKPGAAYKCSFCDTVMPSQTDLESHWRVHSPVAQCNLCHHVLRPRGMKQHLNLAHTKRYSCKYCTLTFETLSSFGTHFRDSHMKFTCDYCGKTFKSKNRIAYHIKNSHIPAFCLDCNRPYLNRCQYQKHCVLMHPERVRRRELREECFCVECDKQFASGAQYRKHLRGSVRHVEIKRQTVPCPECGKVFARKLYMKNHYNLYHLKKTKFYCEMCDKYFARAFGLRVHNKHVHQKVQRVRDKVCDLCGRAFTNNRTMLNHRRTHTGERPHKCPYCTAEFIQKYAMQTHVRTQHKQFT